MLRISAVQMEAFEAAAVAQANVRLAEYARQRFHEQFSGKADREVVGFAAAVRRRARDHGVTAERDVATALDLTVMYGEDFYAAEWASDVFGIPEWDGTHKMNILRRRVRRRVRSF